MTNFLNKILGKNNKKTKVFVGISGGVDSAVSAMLLRDAGFDIVGVFIKTWTPGYIECTQKQDRIDAIRVCAQLNIPFVELDLEKEYKEKVIDYFLEEYKNNRIPNPDIMCNKYIKFDAFYNFAKNQNAKIATGHYAKISEIASKEATKNKNKILILCEPKDKNKDQTYFLYQIKKEILKDIIFPLSDLTKDEVRKVARENNLSVANKKDSQGICMLGGNIGPKEFLIGELAPQKGKVVNEYGKVIGEHDGVILYTIGERHGFSLNNLKDYSSSILNKDKSPYYVIEKDPENNILTVSKNKNYQNLSLESKSIFKNKIYFKEENLFTKDINSEDEIFVQYRYRGEKIGCKCDLMDKSIVLKNDNSENGNFKYRKEFVSGQSMVFYDKDNNCLGGGIII